MITYYVIIGFLSFGGLLSLSVASLVILGMIKPKLVNRILDKIENKSK